MQSRKRIVIRPAGSSPSLFTLQILQTVQDSYLQRAVYFQNKGKVPEEYQKRDLRSKHNLNFVQGKGMQEALSNAIPSEEQTINTQASIMQACSNIENLTSCLSNFQAELGKSGPPTAHSIIHAALRATLDEARRSIDMITKFNSLSVSYREQIAIEDCKELLDFSVSELAWSLMEMSKIRAGVRNVHYEGNLKAWLSAALSNPDTCLEGFEGTDRHLENFISGSLKQVTQLIGNVLALYTQLHSLPFKPPRNDNATATKSSSDEFPEWMTEGDQELLRGSSFRYIIYVKKGVYRENIDMKRKKSYIMFIGDGIGKTVVTGNRNFMQGWTTFRTATVAVSGKGFIARDMTFRNTAGPLNHQAVALRVDSDQSAFYRCSMEGYQDTLYAHSLRQFYRECEIYGTIDYIFGNGAAVFQKLQDLHQSAATTAEGYDHCSGKEETLIKAPGSRSKIATFSPRNQHTWGGHGNSIPGQFS
ncbi:hypothetical protein OIU77_003825 [Salix suchowensis]|uniref:Pectinesterase n=1 Tax=Salix suchowensis TaxID=1278906 RepID=A0ABQ9ATJ5_9ROSI|nr:hypothetical protein OIU77_003825 [Salix suchowensis]